MCVTDVGKGLLRNAVGENFGQSEERQNVDPSYQRSSFLVATFE